MSRYLVDVTVTLRVETTGPEDIEEAVDEVLLTGIPSWQLAAWEPGDFTVVET